MSQLSRPGFDSQGLLAGCLLLLTLTACNSSDEKTTVPADAVARVAGRIISADALEKRMVSRSGGMRRAITREQKQQVLDEMIQREVQVLAAREAGYDTDPEIVAALENLLVARLRRERLDRILAEVSVTDAEIEAYYLHNLQKYTTPPMTRFAIIRFAVYRGASAEKQATVRARADQVLAQALTQPASVKGFGTLAARHSEHQASRYVGGDVGWLKSGAGSGQDSAIVDALARLREAGDIAPVVQADDGFYLVKLLERKAEQRRPLGAVGNSIRRRLEQQKRERAEADWLQALRGKVSPIVIDTEKLDALQVPTGSAESGAPPRPPPLPQG